MPHGRRTLKCGLYGRAQRATGSLGSYVSARTPPWLRELLSMRGCLLLPLQPAPLLLHPGLWTGQGWRDLLQRPLKWSLWCGYSGSPCDCPTIKCMWAYACTTQAEQQLNGTSSSGYGSGWRWAEKGMCTCSYGPHNFSSWSNGVNRRRILHRAWQSGLGELPVQMQEQEEVEGLGGAVGARVRDLLRILRWRKGGGMSTKCTRQAGNERGRKNLKLANMGFRLEAWQPLNARK